MGMNNNHTMIYVYLSLRIEVIIDWMNDRNERNSNGSSNSNGSYHN